MLILDEAGLKRHKEQLEAERQLVKAQTWQSNILRQSIYSKMDETVEIANAEHQWGNPLSWQELEKRLKTLPCGPNLIFKEHSIRPFRAVYYKVPLAENRISIYGRSPAIPEWSTCKLVPRIVRDYSYRKVDRKDLPEMEWHGPRVLDFNNVTDTKNMGWKPKNPDALMPGYTKVYENWGEDPNDIFARGWRTVLLHFHGRGIATIDELEKAFSGTDRLSWSHHSGRQDHSAKRLPF